MLRNIINIEHMRRSDVYRANAKELIIINYLLFIRAYAKELIIILIIIYLFI